MGWLGKDLVVWQIKTPLRQGLFEMSVFINVDLDTRNTLSCMPCDCAFFEHCIALYGLAILPSTKELVALVLC